MALVQSAKNAGDITLRQRLRDYTGEGDDFRQDCTAAAASIGWEREVPKGAGVTGLWRPGPNAGGATGLMAMLLGDGTTVFSLQQDGNKLTGAVEGASVGFFGGNDTPSPIEDGKIDGTSVSFKAGTSTFTGTIKGDQIELERGINLGFRMPVVQEPTGERPAIGPPPDGSDPSFNISIRRPPTVPMVLHRVER